MTLGDNLRALRLSRNMTLSGFKNPALPGAQSGKSNLCIDKLSIFTYTTMALDPVTINNVRQDLAIIHR